MTTITTEELAKFRSSLHEYGEDASQTLERVFDQALYRIPSQLYYNEQIRFSKTNVHEIKSLLKFSDFLTSMVRIVFITDCFYSILYFSL